MAKKFVEEESLVSIADSIRNKAGIEGTLTFPNGFKAAIDSIESGGDTSIEDGLIDGSLSGEYVNNRITILKQYAFIGTSVTNLVLDGLTEIGENALRQASIVQADFKNVTKLGKYALAYNTSLKKAVFENVTSTDTHVFMNCTNLTEAYFPKLTTIAQNTFGGCGFKKILGSYFPNVTRLSSTSNFSNCKNLEIAEFNKLNYMTWNCFSNCAKLKTLILRGDSLCTLSNVDNFTGTPFRNGEVGTVYVPQAYIEEYKSATNWSALESTTFRAIEDWQNIIDISAQPVDTTAAPTENVTFSVVADGMGLSYQWYLCKDGVNWDVPTSPTSITSNYTISNVRANYSGWKVKCVITNVEGYSVETDIVTLTVG